MYSIAYLKLDVHILYVMNICIQNTYFTPPSWYISDSLGTEMMWWHSYLYFFSAPLAAAKLVGGTNSNPEAFTGSAASIFVLAQNLLSQMPKHGHRKMFLTKIQEMLNSHVEDLVSRTLCHSCCCDIFFHFLHHFCHISFGLPHFDPKIHVSSDILLPKKVAAYGSWWRVRRLARPGWCPTCPEHLSTRDTWVCSAATNQTWPKNRAKPWKKHMKTQPKTIEKIWNKQTW